MKHKLAPDPGEFVAQFMADPAAEMTPLERLIHFQRNRAEFLRENGMGHFADRDLMIQRELLDLVAAFYEGAALTYDEAAQISTWEYSTITNYVSQGKIRSKDRKVFLRDLPIAPLNGLLHAVSAMQAVKEHKQREARGANTQRTRRARIELQQMSSDDQAIAARAEHAARKRKVS